MLCARVLGLAAAILALTALGGRQIAFTVAPWSSSSSAAHRELLAADPNERLELSGCVAKLPPTISLIGSLAALAATGLTVRRLRVSTGGAKARVLLRAYEGELGVQAPLGFWDPLGLAQDGDAAAFKRRRATEIKHGRVSMLATMGYITPEVSGKFPGYISPSQGLKFADIPNGLAALSKIPAAGVFQIVLYCLYCESGSLGDNADPSRGPGELGWRPGPLYSTDPEVRTRRLNAEIANGRLAMMAIIGMFYQDGLTGSAWGDWSLYADSPLRAYENESSTV